ncbi:hypothetical protein [Paludisphaera sp.]|uniref:hypothetical protein n=1 Tax=Paludisphaera sp. TaxID=2017432 RepID=UPI00301CFB4E
MAWLWLVEGARPDRWDVLGASVWLAGAAIILHGPRGSWIAKARDRSNFTPAPPRGRPPWTRDRPTTRSATCSP